MYEGQHCRAGQRGGRQRAAHDANRRASTRRRLAGALTNLTNPTAGGKEESGDAFPAPWTCILAMGSLKSPLDESFLPVVILFSSNGWPVQPFPPLFCPWLWLLQLDWHAARQSIRPEMAHLPDIQSSVADSIWGRSPPAHPPRSCAALSSRRLRAMAPCYLAARRLVTTGRSPMEALVMKSWLWTTSRSS